MIKRLYESLEELEKKAGEEGWGGEFREELFDLMLEYFKRSYAKKTRVSVGGMLCHLVVRASKWFGKEGEA